MFQDTTNLLGFLAGGGGDARLLGTFSPRRRGDGDLCLRGGEYRLRRGEGDLRLGLVLRLTGDRRLSRMSLSRLRGGERLGECLLGDLDL